ncbi:MAG TPA: ABC transporter permease, partial [Micromonosporaceae bacterium]
MNLFLLFLLVGLGSGAVYAALGLGLVVTYKGTGIINFGAGAMAAWSAYVFDELRTTGNLVLPVVGIPHAVHLGGAVGLPLAFALALGSAILIGLAAHILVFRPLRRAPVLAKVVASVGVLLSMQALVAIDFGTTGRAPAPVLPDGLLTVAGQTVPRDRLILAGIVIVIAVAVWAYFRFTRLGLATRAAAENERATSLARWSPQLLAASTWVLSNTVVAAVFILAAPTVGLTPTGFSLIVVPALACALVGRLSTIGAVVAAGLILGSLQSELTYAATRTWWPTWAQTGFSDALPFLLVIVVLFLLGRSLPTRGAAESDPLPAVTIPRMRPRLIAALTAAGAATVVLTGGVYRFGVITSMILALIALSLVVLTGMVGQISLAQAAFAGVAGFVLSKLATEAGIGFPWSMLLAALAATVLGVIVGLPALRIRGAQLAVVTLSAAIALEQFIFRNPSFTNPDGNLIPNATVGGINLGIRHGDTIARWQFGIFVLAILVGVAVAVGNLMRSATGRRFLAIRSNERAAASVG